MAADTALKEVAREIATAFRAFKETHDWPQGDCRIYLRLNEDWKTAHVILAAESFGEGDIRDKYRILKEFISNKLNYLLKFLNNFGFTLRTFSQIEEGGIYSIGSDYVDVAELIEGRPIASG